MRQSRTFMALGAGATMLAAGWKTGAAPLPQPDFQTVADGIILEPSVEPSPGVAAAPTPGASPSPAAAAEPAAEPAAESAGAAPAPAPVTADESAIAADDDKVEPDATDDAPEATEEELHAAARNAHIYDFIIGLPDGFDTLVGERGVKLSGGQKQRISIARLFLKDPPLLIFDEATSALDSESEELIQQSMETLCQGRSNLIIAHRLSTVRRADYTYVLRNGRVVEEGCHDDLVAARGYYYDLYNRNIL